VVVVEEDADAVVDQADQLGQRTITQAIE